MADVVTAAEKPRRGRPKGVAVPPTANRLKAIRERLGHTKSAVGAATGLSATAVLGLERGKCPHLRTAYKVAQFFACSVYDIWPEPKQ